VKANDRVGFVINKEVEQCILGAMMLSKQALSQMIEFLTAENFYYDEHRKIFECAKNLFMADSAVDIITLKDELKKNNWLQEIGGSYYLSELNAKTPTSANVMTHARMLKERYLKWNYYPKLQEVVNKFNDNEGDVFDAINELGGIQNLLSRERTSHTRSKTAGEIAVSFKAQIEKAINADISELFVQTGFRELDNMVLIDRTDLVVIAGRPSMGKTAFGLTLICDALVKCGTVLFISLEMNANAICGRYVSGKTGISYNRSRKGELTEYEFGRVMEVTKEFGAMDIIIEDLAVSITQIENIVDLNVREKNISSVVIDYFQLIKPISDKGKDTRDTDLTQISNALKRIAKKYNVPIFLLTQLNREVEKRQNKRPVMADIRECGGLELDADLIILLNRPEYYGITTYENKRGEVISTDGMAEIIVAKQRNGETGTVILEFDKRRMWFNEDGYSMRLGVVEQSSGFVGIEEQIPGLVLEEQANFDKTMPAIVYGGEPF